MTLSSLSSTDYPCLLELCDDLLDYCAPKDIGVSLPSLRADTFSMNLMERLQRVRKGGLTFAPEAGTQRLRDAINKNLREEDLLQSCRTAFSGGWSGVKLYFCLLYTSSRAIGNLMIGPISVNEPFLLTN